MSSPLISNDAAPMDYEIGADLDNSSAMISNDDDCLSVHPFDLTQLLSELTLWQAIPLVPAPKSCDFGGKWFIDLSLRNPAKWGIDMIIDPCIIHLPIFLSIHHPLSQLVLYAKMRCNDMFSCYKPELPKSIVHTIERLIEGSVSFPSLSKYEAGWFSANPKSESHNTRGVSELKSGEINCRSNEPHLPLLFDISTNKETCSIIFQTLPGGQDGFILSSGADTSANTETKWKLSSGADTCANTETKWSGASKNIFMLSITSNGRSSSEKDSFSSDNPVVIHDSTVESSVNGDLEEISHVLTEGLNNNGGTDPFSNDNPFHDSAAETSVMGNFSMLSSFFSGRNGGCGSEGTADALTEGNHNGPVVILDTGAQTSVTGDFSMLASLVHHLEGKVFKAANGNIMESYISGSVRLERFELNDVFYLPDVGNRTIVSGIELDKLGYSCYTAKGKCIISDLSAMTWSWRTWTWTPKIVGEGCLVDEFYMLDYLRAGRNNTLL